MKWSDRLHPSIREIIREDPQFAAAAAFGDRFRPAKGVDYGWVCEYAPKKWESRLGMYEKMEGRAASLLTWASGGVGVVLAGATLAVADGKMPWLVALAFAPAVVLALLACRLAVRARRTIDLFMPPDIEFSAACAEHEAGQAATLVAWHMAEVRVGTAIRRRAKWLNTGLTFGLWSVVALAIPFAASILRAAFG